MGYVPGRAHRGGNILGCRQIVRTNLYIVSSSPLTVARASDSLETILSHLSARVTNVIAGGRCVYHLRYLLEFLAAWEKRPAYLTPMAYQWCSTISEVATRLRIPPGNHLFRRLQLDNLPDYLTIAMEEFSNAGPGCDPVHSEATSSRAHRHPYCLDTNIYPYLLCVTLDIGFRPATLSDDQSALHLDWTTHHEWAFEAAFSSDDDDAIADALSIWVVDGDRTPPGSCARYIAKRVEWGIPFSPRLRRVSIRVIDRTWRKEREVSELDTLRWVNRLDIDVDDIRDQREWAWRLVEVIRSPTGLESLSSHYWHVMAKLVVASEYSLYLESRDTEVMRSLEEADDWEKLGAWLVAIWLFLPGSEIPESESMEGIEEVTLKTLLRQPSALPRLEELCEAGKLRYLGGKEYKDRLQRILDQARVSHSTSGSPPPYVSVCPD